MMGDTVWFDGGDRASVGQEAGDVEVVATSPPWSATLRWRGVEFEVDYWERTTGRLMTDPPKGGARFERPEQQENAGGDAPGEEQSEGTAGEAPAESTGSESDGDV
jgi:hypothetical protein